MPKNPLVTPVLKWVGGKRQLLETLAPLLPKKTDPYCEPFVGGGAMLFYLQPKVAYINDANEELMNVYRVIQTDVDALIEQLGEFRNEEDFFYEVREWDRDQERYQARSEVERAARILYLNKTCYNGLYRVNNAGEFNSPFGNYRNPNIVNAPVLRAVSHYFNTAEIHMRSGDYENILNEIPQGTFIYLDPPYDPVSETANFTGYVRGGFPKEDQVRLRQCCDQLRSRRMRFMLSNSDTEFIRREYKTYKIEKVQAKRSINSVGEKRGDVDEVIVRNYGYDKKRAK